MRLLVGLIILTIVGCTEPQDRGLLTGCTVINGWCVEGSDRPLVWTTLPVRINVASDDPTFVAATETAIAVWNDAAGYELLRRAVHDPTGPWFEAQIERGEPGPTAHIIPDELAGTELWWNDAVLFLTYTTVRRATPDAAMTAVITHELGHVLGLDHDDWPGSIMDPVIDVDHPGDLAPTAHDLELLRATYHP
jgi:hypothetical protein